MRLSSLSDVVVGDVRLNLEEFSRRDQVMARASPSEHSAQLSTDCDISAASSPATPRMARSKL